MTKTLRSPAPGVGSGLYSIPEAARLTGVRVNRIREWLKPDRPLFPRFYAADDRAVSFLELMELQFVKLFRSEGVSLLTIRRAANVAARKFETDYPFAVKRFDTDGSTIFATLLSEQEGDTKVEDLEHGQYVFNQVVRPFFRKLEYHGVQVALRFWPLDMDSRVVLDPARKFGRPIDAETGVETAVLYGAVQADGGQSHKAVADWYAVPLKAVDDAVRFEKSLAS
jgi:uncharacterized protein (DUF433 family)